MSEQNNQQNPPSSVSLNDVEKANISDFLKAMEETKKNFEAEMSKLNDVIARMSTIIVSRAGGDPKLKWSLNVDTWTLSTEK